MQDMQILSLGGEDPLGEEMTTCGILAWRIPWTEKPGRLQSMGSHRVDTTERAHVFNIPGSHQSFYSGCILSTWV